MSEQKKILVVENDDFYVEILGTFAKLFLHASTIFVKTSTEALNHCKQEKPDVIILNLDLPGKEAFEFMEKLRDDSDLKPIGVVGLSSDCAEETALGAGCDSYLKKPFKVRELQAHIERLFAAA